MYAPLLSLVLEHSYFDGAPPLRASPRDPDSLARAGILVKETPAALTLWQEVEEQRPDMVAFDIRATNPDLLRVTPPMAAEGPAQLSLAPPGGPSEHRIDPAGFGGARGADGRRALMHLSITLPAEGAPTLRLVFPAVETIWAYHVLGRHTEGLSVVDTDGEVRFEAAGDRHLPDGRTAQSWRSDRPLALRARATARFSLMRAGPFGPMVLVDALPGAGAVTSYAKGRGPDAQMQSDIYVTL
ncbi:MAG: hypothetical protein ACXIU8_06610 [Alkalilacustris sp.]